MKTTDTHASVLPEPGEDAIRDYAYQLYLQSGCVPGRDFDHWLEATACLKAKIALDQPAFHPHGAFSGLVGEKTHSLAPWPSPPAPDS